MSAVPIQEVIESMEGPGGKRTVIKVNGNEEASLGMVLGKDLQREFNLEPSDTLYLDIDVEARTGTIHFPEK